MAASAIFHERRVTCSTDPLVVTAALAANATGNHVLYENQGVFGWADNPYAEITVDTAGTTIAVGGDRTSVAAGPGVLDGLARALGSLGLAGWRGYGWVSFELSHLLHGGGGLPAGTPLAHVLIPRREARFAGGTVLLRALSEHELDVLHEEVARAGQAPPRPAEGRVTPAVDDHGAADYRAAVAGAVADIRAGRLDKVILSRTVPVTTPIDLPATYLQGRRGNNPARSFLLDLGGWQVAGFSPEIVTRVTPEGVVTTQPLAGTRAFDGDPDIDLARRTEMYRDAKEVYEHAISVRLAAEELSLVCARDGVKVDDFMDIKERGSVQHLASTLSGSLAADRTPWDALTALFPAVTASGIPKAEACDLIRRAEDGERGLYSGAVLTVDADGTLDAALVLRSVFRHRGRTWLRAGAGIVADSTPARELEETREKLRSVSRFLVPRAPVGAEAAPAEVGGTR